MKVIGERVIVKTEDQTLKTRPSGLFTLEAYAPHVVGTVVACADGLDVRPEDIVIFSPEAGIAMTHEHEEYLVLHPDEILAVYEENRA